MKFSDDYQFDEDEGRVWYERVARQVLDHPPACLTGFNAQLIPLEDDTWNGRISWKLSCSCGNRTGKILGYSLAELKPSYDGPLYFVTPLAFQCSACNRATEIIDTDLHGYDGECKKRFGGYGAVTCRGTGERSVFICQECGGNCFEITTCFQHSHFDIIEDEPELEPSAQDFFDWFACQGICINCHQEQDVGDYELA